MSSNKKRGLIALAVVMVVALGVAIPTVIASSSGGNSAGLAPSASGPAPPAVVTTNSSCVINRMGYASNTATSLANSSTSFSTVPGMVVDFTATKGSCVEVEYSAWTFAGNVPDPGALMAVRALVDGTVCQPGQVQFSGDDDENVNNEWARTHSFTFVCSMHGSVDHPHHTAWVEWANYFSGDTIYTHTPTMVVRWGA